ncbi:sterol desaturase family protein [Pacificispira sp.]|uniref:sterol desaturase family protein n=1 Tax=Pacificispira sp. TaxID=2888761 RepID=UPI003BABFA0E
MRHITTTLVRYGLWPGLLALCLGTTIYGVLHDSGFLLFNIAYLALAVVLFFAERALPFERAWLKNDGQIWVDLAHTALSKGVAQVLIVVGAVFGLAENFAESGLNIWPTEWPLLAQVALGLVVIEAGLYAAHRLSHEVPLFWRFHAVHHSAKRLSFINTGRFHFVDTAVSILLSQPLLFLAGAPIEVFKLTSATTAFIGMLTHCNVDMRFGWLSYVFNTPTLHRFHHSKDLREGNKNYGENLVLFDLLFGTYYNASYRPPVDIGIDGPMPDDFLGQLAQPFRNERKAAVTPADISPAGQS